jgi:excisionase family DNA binding protein
MPATPPIFPPRWGTVQSASRYTGLSVGLIRKWLQDGYLTKFRPGGRGRTLLDLNQLDELIKAGKGVSSSRGGNLKKAVPHG